MNNDNWEQKLNQINKLVMEPMKFGNWGMVLAKNCKKTEFIAVIGIVQSYLKKWGERLNFDNGVFEIARKSTMCQEREKIEFW